MYQNQQVNTPPEQELPTPRDGATLGSPSRPQPGSTTRQQRAVALEWVRRGFPVIPCSRTDKGPLVAGFGREATAEQLAPFSDPEQVTAWWSGRFARAHVGLLTGRGADGRGLLVVDLDMAKVGTTLPDEYADVASGADVLERLAAAVGQEWPETYMVLTPSGGVHLYFQQPAEGPLIGCATGAGPTAPHLGPLIDVRGVGGLVIAAGSFSSAQEFPYRRASPPGLLPQPIPGWLLERLRPAAAATPARRPAPVLDMRCGGSRAERYAAAALMGAVKDVREAPEGERNRRLFAAARRLGELSGTAPRVLSESLTTEALLDAGTRAGVSEREASRTVRSGWERGVRDGSGAGAA